VTNLANGYLGTEFFHATSVNSNGTVTLDVHDSPSGDGWGSLMFDTVTATGLRIAFSNPAPVYPYCNGATIDQLCNHYQVYEIEARSNPAVLPVTIDIKPGSFPNSINPRNNGVIPVAILTTNTFDAKSVVPSTVRFGPNSALPVQWALEDVNGDRRLDMILHFRTQETGIKCGNTSATLQGSTTSAQAFIGSDGVTTTGCK
jgi:hypothetical protein